MYAMKAPENVTCQQEQFEYLPGAFHPERVLMSLDAALHIVAKSSFYEDKLIEPVGFGLYTVQDTHAHASDEWEWSYAKGIHSKDSVSETSRLMDHYELFDRSEHIRDHMSDAIEALQDGHAVEFAYASVDHEWDSFEHDDTCLEPSTECMCDRGVGWILCALWDN